MNARLELSASGWLLFAATGLLLIGPTVLGAQTPKAIGSSSSNTAADSKPRQRTSPRLLSSSQQALPFSSKETGSSPKLLPPGIVAPTSSRPLTLRTAQSVSERTGSRQSGRKSKIQSELQKLYAGDGREMPSMYKNGLSKTAISARNQDRDRNLQRVDAQMSQYRTVDASPRTGIPRRRAGRRSNFLQKIFGIKNPNRRRQRQTVGQAGLPPMPSEAPQMTRLRNNFKTASIPAEPSVSSAKTTANNDEATVRISDSVKKPIQTVEVDSDDSVDPFVVVSEVEADSQQDPFSAQSADQDNVVDAPIPTKAIIAENDNPDHSDHLKKISDHSEMTGLKGFCPVMLRNQRDLVDARPEFSSHYESVTFHFSSQEAQADFEANPAKYAPIQAGHDVVLLVESEVELQGSLDHAVWFKEQLYLFSSADSVKRFIQEPGKFTATQIDKENNSTGEEKK